MRNPNEIGYVLDVGRKGSVYEFKIDGIKFSKGCWSVTFEIINDDDFEKIDTAVRGSFVASPFRKQSVLKDMINKFNGQQTSIESPDSIAAKMDKIVDEYENDKAVITPIDFLAGVEKYASGSKTKVTLRVSHAVATNIVNNFNSIVGNCALVISEAEDID